MNGRRSFLIGQTAAPAHAARDAANFTNALLRTHDGRTVKFYDDLLKGKLVVINMMYTSCAGICPANTASLKAVQQALGKRVGRDIFMVRCRCGRHSIARKRCATT
jgi:protein SCO1/2